MINACYGRTSEQLTDIMDGLEFGEEVSDEDENIIEELKKNNFQCRKILAFYFFKYGCLMWNNVRHSQVQIGQIGDFLRSVSVQFASREIKWFRERERERERERGGEG